MLNPATLTSSLTDIMDPNKTRAKTPAEAATKWAAAYKGYASTAMSLLGGAPIPASLSAAESTLKTVLEAAFTAGGGAAPMATSLSTAFTAFWLVPPMAFSGAFPGLVTLVAGTALLQSGLIAAWAQVAALGPGATAAAAAAAHATVLDAFTRTVIVTHPTVPVPTIGPIV